MPILCKFRYITLHEPFFPQFVHFLPQYGKTQIEWILKNAVVKNKKFSERRYKAPSIFHNAPHLPKGFHFAVGNDRFSR